MNKEREGRNSRCSLNKHCLGYKENRDAFLQFCQQRHFYNTCGKFDRKQTSVHTP